MHLIRRSKLNAQGQWDDDPTLNLIVSPLMSNANLRSSIHTLQQAGKALPHANQLARDLHFAEVNRLATYLMQRAEAGGFEQLDWAAMFMTDGGIRDLYDAESHWLHVEFIEKDVKDLLTGADWEERARSDMSKRELANLLAVLNHLQPSDWDEQALRVQHLLSE